MNNAFINNKVKFYREDLIAYLSCYHPDYLNRYDWTSASWANFLEGRARAAADEEIRKKEEGVPPPLAEKYALDILLQGFRFSLYAIVKEILEADYPNIEPDISPVTVSALESSCRPIVEKFALGDDYLTDPIYGDFIEEVKQHIHNFLIENI